MAVRMASLNRKTTGAFVARKGIPEDVRDEYFRLFGVRWEERLTIPAQTPKHEAKTRLGEWTAEIETRIETLRAAARGDGQPLTHRNAHALAGRWYNWYIAQYEDDPGSPERWEELRDQYAWNVLRPHAPEEYEINPSADKKWEWARKPEVRAGVRPLIAQEARVASFLASEGIVLNSDAYALFVDAVSDNLPQALWLLERRARGDYSPDDTPDSFPAFTPNRVYKAQGLDCWQLFEVFVAASQLAPRTVTRWRAVFLKLRADFPDKPASTISEDEARVWITNLVSSGRGAATVSSVWIPASRRVFSWAKRNKHIHKNPFADVKVDKEKTRKLREGEWFTHEERTIILSACLQYSKPKSAFERAKRWAMWLCAYSGARAGEITQLRGVDISQRGPFYVMNLTPEAGSIKTGEARVVPLHEHVIAQGFLEFVEQQGKGPLFYNPAPEASLNTDRLKPSRTRAESTRARLGDWVRMLGVDDPEVSPTHGWRHTFQHIADQVGITEKVCDAIVGHKPATIGRGYAKPTAEVMAEALRKFPRYDLSADLVLSKSATANE